MQKIRNIMTFRLLLNLFILLFIGINDSFDVLSGCSLARERFINSFRSLVRFFLTSFSFVSMTK